MSAVSVLTLLVTNRCPLQCSHCGPESGPDQLGALTLADAVAAMEDAKAEGCTIVNFSGGEPFILGTQLTAMVSAATGLGLIPRITTGSYWSSTSKAASSRLAPLADAGLKQLYLSCSDAHLEAVPIRNVIEASQAARSRGVDVCIVINGSARSKTTSRSVREAFEAAQATIPFLFLSPIIPFGRAARSMSPSDLRLTPVSNFAGPCPSLTRHPTVHANGDITGCAVVFGGECSPLRAGTIHEQRLSEVLRDMRSNPLVNWIHGVGVVQLKELIENNSSIRFGDRYVNICHLCGDILQNQQALSFLLEHGFLHPQQLGRQFNGPAAGTGQLIQLSAEAAGSNS